MVNKSELKRGDKVTYTSTFGDSSPGIVKEVHPSKNAAWVVYSCGGEWKTWDKYTGALTSLDNLEKGWNKGVLRIWIRGTIEDDGERTVELMGKKLNIGRSLTYRRHSPTGFNWGYGGSGPAQLALAIMLEIFDDETAKLNYQDFKFKHVGSWPNLSDVAVTVQLDLSKIKRPEEKTYSI